MRSHIYLRVIYLNNYSLKIIFALSATLVFIVGFFAEPSSAVKGVSDGLTLCSTAVIPSLFPFIFLSDFLIRSGLCDIVGKHIAPAVNSIFRLPGSAGCAVLMSLVGGYPVGAKMISQLIEDGSITRSQGKRMLVFCVNAGPAFVIGTVGTVMLSSPRAGIVLYASAVISSLVMGVFLRFFCEKQADEKIHTEKQFVPDIISQSVLNATNSMLMMCAWILLFSCVNALVRCLPLSQRVMMWVNIITEVTGGCAQSTKAFPLCVTALVLGWSGLSVHCQLYPFIRQTGLKYSHFCLSRLIHGGISTVIAELLFRIFPCEVSVFSTFTDVTPSLFSVSVPAAVAMLILSAFVIVENKVKSLT